MPEETYESLTPRQIDVLRFIEAFIQQYGFPPTLMEIGHNFGIRNPNGIRNHLLALERKGFIQKEADRSRAIRVTRRANALGQAISAIKSKIGGHEGQVYSLEYHLAWCTRKMRQTLSGEVLDEVRKGFELVVEHHNWELTKVELLPDHVVMSVRVGPTDSPERVVKSFKKGTALIWLRHPLEVKGRGLWGRGFMAATDAAERDALLDSYLTKEREKT